VRPSDAPLRAELFSVEQLSRHAKSLAASHEVVVRQASNSLLARLGHNEDVLGAFHRATLAGDPNRRVTPAAEWLLDNFYLIEEQVHMARRHLPRGYSQELPRLVRGSSAGLPRVYDLVLEFISHVDAQIDAGPLSAFVAAYQTVADLTLGELWAIPIMLRLGLIENLQRIATRLNVAREDRELANSWVDRLQGMAETHPSDLVVVVADMAKSALPVSSSFVAEFCQRLSRQGPVLHLARGWLEQRLLEQGLTVEHLVHLESQQQAADQVSVSHSINSLRFLSAMDWKEFVETLSRVEARLRTDPADVYGKMDFRPAIAVATVSRCWPVTAKCRKGTSRSVPSNWPQTARGNMVGRTGQPMWAITCWTRVGRRWDARSTCGGPGARSSNAVSAAFRWRSMWAAWGCSRRSVRAHSCCRLTCAKCADGCCSSWDWWSSCAPVSWPWRS
jgi:hypothetical protein